MVSCYIKEMKYAAGVAAGWKGETQVGALRSWLWVMVGDLCLVLGSRSLDGCCSDELIVKSVKSACYRTRRSWRGSAMLPWLICAVAEERAAATVEVEMTWLPWWCECRFCWWMRWWLQGKKDMGVFYWLSLDNSLAFQLVSYVTLSDTLVLFLTSKIPWFQWWCWDLMRSITWELVWQNKNTTPVSFPN